jgi:purine-binding chemotaxis protein CheW
MDIAKIRKKLKETQSAGGQQSLAGSGKPDQEEAGRARPPEKEPETVAAKADPGQKSDTRQCDKTVADHVGVEGEKTQDGEGKIEEVRTAELVEILTFSLLKEDFAFRVSQLEEILRSQRMTIVPTMPAYVLGITSLRGKVIPVIDLKTKLTLTDKPSDTGRGGKILIVKGPKGPIGVAVDKVIGVVRVAKDEIIPPPSHLTEGELKFIEGVTVLDKRFISIMNMEEAVAI